MGCDDGEDSHDRNIGAYSDREAEPEEMLIDMSAVRDNKVSLVL